MNKTITPPVHYRTLSHTTTFTPPPPSASGTAHASMSRDDYERKLTLARELLEHAWRENNVGAQLAYAHALKALVEATR